MAASASARPTGTDLAAAVRAAFESNRLQAAWRMAGGASAADRMPAVQAIFRMLEKEGLTFEDVMTAILTIRPAAPTPGISMADAFSGFEGIFGDRPFGRRPQPAPASDERPRGRSRRHRSGADIPATIKGTVSIDDRRKTRTGRMVVFTVTDGDDVYGPIVCFTATGIGVIEACGDEYEYVSMSVRQPNGAGQMPSATNVRIL